MIDFVNMISVRWLSATEVLKYSPYFNLSACIGVLVLPTKSGADNS